MPSVGILGTGFGLKVQVPQFRKAGLTIGAIYSRSAERARAIASEHGIPIGCDSVETLCETADVDIVSCAGPTSTRCEQTLAVLRHGKHVLVDKPMAMTETEATSMLEAARAAHGLFAWMDFELRCTPAVLKMREIISSGKLGTPLFISCRSINNSTWLNRQHSHWATREHGGGVFSAVGTHFVDLARFATGREVARLSATQRTLVDNLPNELGEPTPVTSDGLTMASLEMVEVAGEGGGDADVEKRQALPVNIFISSHSPALPNEIGLLICCQRGSLKLNLLESTLEVYRTGDTKPETYGGGGNAWSEVGTVALGRAIRAAIGGGTGAVEPGGIRRLYWGPRPPPKTKNTPKPFKNPKQNTKKQKLQKTNNKQQTTTQTSKNNKQQHNSKQNTNNDKKTTQKPKNKIETA